ncbi:MAG: hypothetical protein ABJB12_13305 [Pseudomonadota bacterium]
MLGLCLWAAGCSSVHEAQPEPLMNVPIEPLQGTSSIVFHRPLPLGSRLRVQGVFKEYHRITPKANGFVVAEKVEHVQLAYNLTKTFLELDLDGDPTRMRYDVAEIASNDARIPDFNGLGARRSSLLHTPDMDQLAWSRGQQYDIALHDGKFEFKLGAGKFSPIEQEVLTDTFGPPYELWLEEALGHLFAPKGPKRVGEQWSIADKWAARLLERCADMGKVSHVTGQATFVGTERVGAIAVQRVEAWIKGEGKLREALTYPIRANNNNVEIKYIGLFPVDLSLPAVSHQWSIHGKGQIVVEVNDALGDIDFETMLEHESQVQEVTR